MDTDIDDLSVADVATTLLSLIVKPAVPEFEANGPDMGKEELAFELLMMLPSLILGWLVLNAPLTI